MEGCAPRANALLMSRLFLAYEHYGSELMRGLWVEGILDPHWATLQNLTGQGSPPLDCALWPFPWKPISQQIVGVIVKRGHLTAVVRGGDG